MGKTWTREQLEAMDPKRFRKAAREAGMSVKTLTREEIYEALTSGVGITPPPHGKKVSEHATGPRKELVVDFAPQPEPTPPKVRIEIDWKRLVAEVSEEVDQAQAEAAAKAEPPPERPTYWPLGSLAPQHAKYAARLLKDTGFPDVKLTPHRNFRGTEDMILVQVYTTKEGSFRAAGIWYDARQKIA